MTRPTGVGAVVLGNAGSAIADRRSLFAGYVCDRLAALGHDALRLDYRGAGESTGEAAKFLLDRPPREDLLSAVGWFREQGLERFFLAGSSYGARTVLSGAGDIPGLDGIVLWGLPVMDVVRRRLEELPVKEAVGSALRRSVRLQLLGDLRDAHRRDLYWAWLARAWHRPVSTRRDVVEGASQSVIDMVLDELAGLAASGVPTLLLYGVDDPHYQRLTQTGADRLEEIMGAAANSAEMIVVPSMGHPGLGEVGLERVWPAVRNWLRQRRVVDPVLVEER